MSKKPVVLAILDGYGESQYKDGNAIYTAKTPRMDEFMSKYPKAVSSNYNYYQISGQIINSYEQFKTYILSEIKVGKKKIVTIELEK